VGPYVQAFEESLANLTGAKKVVAVSSGTAALQIALRVAGVKAGDEVLLPSLSFVATANAVSYLGGTPHFVDVEEETLGVDPDALREWLSLIAERGDEGLINKKSGRVIRALVPMHTFGHPSRIDALCEVAGDFGIVVVEDAAESLGSSFMGKHTGTFGRLGAVSFNGNKIVTTGGGGAILTDDQELAAYAKHLSTTAKEPHDWEYVHDKIGYNFRMPNINAALGLAQLEQLPGFLASKRLLAKKYQEAFKSVAEVSIVTEPRNAESNYWLQTVRLSDEVLAQRDEILRTLNASGFGARPVWRPLHLLSIYDGALRAPLPVTEKLGQSLINLPSSSGLA
jgi:aminotransferase in exopolysaccharide biosynthesis